MSDFLLPAGGESVTGYARDTSPEVLVGPQHREIAFRWATVVDNAPLSILLDGDTDPLPLIPETLIQPSLLVPGLSRVWVQMFGRRVIVMGTSNGFSGGGGGSAFPLPAGVSASGPAANALVVATTGVWQSLATPVFASLILPAAAWVRIDFGAWHQITGALVSDIRAGVALTGSVVQPAGPVAPESYGLNTTFHRPPVNAVQFYEQADNSLVVLAPAGTLTAEFQGYVNGAVTAGALNYATLRLTPIAWADATPPSIGTNVFELALPPGQDNTNTAAITPTSTTFVSANCDIVMTNPHPTKSMRVYVQWQWQATVGSSGTPARAVIQTSGATVLGIGNRGEESREGVSTSTATGTSSRMIELLPGVTTITVGGMLTAAGSQAMSMWGLRAIPVGYVGSTLYPPVMGMIDTGWIQSDTDWVANTGWAIVAGAFYYRRYGSLCQVRGQVTRTGAAITVPADGNISQQTILSGIPGACTPSVSGPMISFNAGRLASFYASGTGTIVMNAVAPGANIATNEDFSFSGSYLI